MDGAGRTIAQEVDFPHSNIKCKGDTRHLLVDRSQCHLLHRRTRAMLLPQALLRREILETCRVGATRQWAGMITVDHLRQEALATQATRRKMYR